MTKNVTDRIGQSHITYTHSDCLERKKLWEITW